jgi:serine phosphatase RsbU (regulator of sigma subunit)
MPGTRPTLTQRLFLRVGGIAGLLVLVIVALVVAAIGFRDDANERERLLPASADAVELSGLLAARLEASTDPGGAPAGSEGLRDERQRIDLLLGRIEGELAGEEALLAELGELRADIVGWQAAESSTATAGDPAAPDEVRDLLAAAVGRADDLSAAITDRISDSASDARWSRAWFLRAVAAAVLLALVLLVVGTLALRRVVTRPVRRLSSDVAAVAEGAFDHPIRGDGSRELADLAQSVTRMRDRILSERDNARRADEAVDQQAPAVAALRTLLSPRLAACPPELDAAGALVPADGTLAGDWFDIAARPNGIVVAIGDVCGHGIDAGLLAVRTKFALLDAIDLGLHPEAALELASARFGRDDTFATAMVAEVDLLAGTCRYASAGHTPLLLLRGDGSIERLERTGPLIGLAQGPRPNASVALQPGDMLVLYTDGVVEARPRGGTQFLESRLLDLLNESASQSAGAVAESILAAVVSHCAGVCPDDATIAVIRVNGLRAVERVA